MYRFWIAVKKELLVLLNDKAGLVLMFVMPLMLVFIITIIQDSAFKAVNENRISLLIINQDKGKQGKELVEMLKESRSFKVTQDDKVELTQINQFLHDNGYLTALYLPADFSEKLNMKADVLSSVMMEELGLQESVDTTTKIDLPAIKFYHDPALQENYSTSIVHIVDAFIKKIEGELLISHICVLLDLEKAPKKLQELMIDNRIEIERISASLSENETLPNSTQHNVPAWTIFSMFFMVISLGSNIVKERLNGSFLRLKSMPTSFMLVLSSKLFLYVVAVFIQVSLIFSIASYTFPFIGLPELIMPPQFLAAVVVVFCCALSAISYSMVVGTFCKTQEQTSGFGAVSIVILAALGGIWVPNFILPEYLKIISYFSPLHWCLECFYTLFLRGGSWSALAPYLLNILLFSLFCFGVTFAKLKSEKII